MRPIPNVITYLAEVQLAFICVISGKILYMVSLTENNYSMYFHVTALAAHTQNIVSI